MNNYDVPNSSIHVLARALLVSGDEIILCHVKDADWYFLPGGHVENGESAKKTLLRELNEEIGDGEYKIKDYIGTCECVFPLLSDTLQHEINMIFLVEVPVGFVADSQEGHLEFIKVKKEDLFKYNILPDDIGSSLRKWQQDGLPFFKSLI